MAQPEIASQPELLNHPRLAVTAQGSQQPEGRGPNATTAIREVTHRGLSITLFAVHRTC